MLTRVPKKLALHPFQTPSAILGPPAAILDFKGTEVLHVVSECPLRCKAGNLQFISRKSKAYRYRMILKFSYPSLCGVPSLIIPQGATTSIKIQRFSLSPLMDFLQVSLDQVIFQTNIVQTNKTNKN